LTVRKRATHQSSCAGPRELLADCAHHTVRNLGALEHRILSPQLPADRAARLPHRADDAIELWIGSFDDTL
jgi:hypothetical protein